MCQTGSDEFLDTAGAECIVNNNIGHLLLWRDPLDIEGILFGSRGWTRPPGALAAVFVRGTGSPYLSAMSGVEIALWDLAGKAVNAPVYRLLAGACEIGCPFTCTRRMRLRQGG